MSWKNDPSTLIKKTASFFDWIVTKVAGNTILSRKIINTLKEKIKTVGRRRNRIIVITSATNNQLRSSKGSIQFSSWRPRKQKQFFVSLHYAFISYFDPISISSRIIINWIFYKLIEKEEEKRWKDKEEGGRGRGRGETSLV